MNAVTGLPKKKSLIIDNYKIGYPYEQDRSKGERRSLFDGDYRDVSEGGGITWLYHGSHSYKFDDITISGQAHVAILSNTSADAVSVSAGALAGDRSGVLHCGRRQTFNFDYVNVYLPTNIMAYR